MGVPGGASARLERDTGADCTCRSGRLEQRINAYCTGKVLSRSFAGRLCATSFNVHFLNSSIIPTKTTCQNQAGTSFEWDFDGNIVLRVVGFHVPAVLVPELLKYLVELRLVGN